MATIWTHCSITATKAGKGHGGNKQQIIKHFCTAMKQFIDVFGALYICHEDEREAPSLVRHLFSRQNEEEYIYIARIQVFVIRKEVLVNFQ